jgi:hypothetical protein
MSTPSGGRVPKRPRPVTTGAVIAIVSSSLLLLELADSLSTLHTTATRENIQEFLSKPPGDGFDVTVAQFTEVIRWYALVSGALGAMALVFAVFVLKRHRGARIGLTVAAGLLLLTMPLTGLAPIFVAIAAVLVWTRPGRDWYSGRTHMEAFQTPSSLPLMTEQGPPPSPYPFGTPPGEAAPSWPPAQPPDAAAEPTAPMPPPAYPPYPGYSGYPVAYPGFGYPYAAQSRDPNRRPWTVTAAAVLTWIGAGATALLMLLFVLVLAAGADSFVTEFDTAARDSDLTLTREQILAVGWGVAAVLLFWSVVSIVLAVLVVRRNNGARIALVISSGMTVVVSLIAIMSGISAITLLLGIATGVLLFTGGANEWYRNRGNAVPVSGYQTPFGPPGGSPIPGPAYWPTPSTPPTAPPNAGDRPPAEGGPDPEQAPPPPPPPPPTERPKPW